jgi:hypothetical protein
MASWVGVDVVIHTEPGRPSRCACALLAGCHRPNIPINLDLDSQNLGPSQPSQPLETLTIAWVAEYTMN